MITGSVEDVLHWAALVFDASGDVRVSIAHRMEFTGGEKLRGNVVTVAHARLLVRQRP